VHPLVARRIAPHVLASFIEEDLNYAVHLGCRPVDDGKPTQRHIAYLGGITENAIRIVHQRYYFCEKDRVCRIEPDGRCERDIAVSRAWLRTAPM
jgi:hypothetical protein